MQLPPNPKPTAILLPLAIIFERVTEQLITVAIAVCSPRVLSIFELFFFVPPRASSTDSASYSLLFVGL